MLFHMDDQFVEKKPIQYPPAFFISKKLYKTNSITTCSLKWFCVWMNFLYFFLCTTIERTTQNIFYKIKFSFPCTLHLKCMWMKNLLTTYFFHVDEFLRLILLFLRNHFSVKSNMDAASAAFGVIF